MIPILLTLVVILALGSYAYLFAEQLAPLNLTYVVLTMFIIFTTILTFIEGIYKSQGVLFEAKDNDLLFSIPISKTRILFIRIFKLIAFQFLYNTLFMVPAIIVYAIFEKPGISFYLISFIALLLLPIIPTILGCVFGYIVKALSSKFKAKKIVQVMFTMITFVLIFGASSNMESLISQIAQNANSIQEIITKVYCPAGLYINLIQDFKILDLIGLIMVSIIPAIIFVYIASIFYFKIISRLNEKGSGIANRKNKTNESKTITKKETYKVKAKLTALINKELKRFFSSPVFIINATFGIVLLIVLTIGIVINFNGIINSIFQGEDIGLSINEIKVIMPKIFYCIVIFVACMTCVTPSMISLEGKSFNIAKSLPISPKKILLSKILTSNIISIPAILICDIIFFATFKVEIIDVLFIILASIIMPTFIAIVGILMNLKYPKMKATSDTEVVKQSMSSTLSIFIGLIVGFISIAIVIFGNIIGVNLCIALELAVFCIIDFVLWKCLGKYGVRRFREINV